ncbi:class I SAM-dependent methyltransferase [Ktedonosporobacter rubrisoli]|uniref:Class I SAM-dependent methyltransferase n=1 Tax=Ktedonosporobacter rubrisoli TaxID=2509675 RepID=A0A4P6JKD6_KTERU|nr:class I SAM-dependent methyltransferase [Ktedonosporobacter rubrisoli]
MGQRGRIPEQGGASVTSSPQQPQEQPSTYFVQDRSNEAELTRLHIQDQMLTKAMGGVLPEQPDPSRFSRILDVGCGTGDWLIEAAQTYPHLSLLIGVDASRNLLAYARDQAEAQGVSERVEFQVMDALRRLDFPRHYFDLVNHRAAGSWLRTWDWPKLLSEYQRICKPGGVIRVTESDAMTYSSSVASKRLFELLVEAFHQAGHLFTAKSDGMVSELAHLLQQHGVQQVQTREYVTEYRMGTEQGQHFAEDMKLGFRTALPFIRKWRGLPEDYEELYQRMLSDLQQPDLVITWRMLTAWGTNTSV